MKVGNLKKDMIINEWLGTLNPKPNTERNYLLAMQAFTEWTGKTPKKLLQDAEAEIKAGKLMRERNVKKYLIGFRRCLQDKNLAPTTVKGYMTGVKSFYTLFDIELPTLPRLDKKARPLEKNNRIPTKEELQEVLKICDPLEKAVLLVGAASGLSANEIINLKIKDFKQGYDEETEVTTLTLRREKTGVDFITFLTPEASRAVLAYLKYRGRTEKTGEKRRLNQLEKQRVFNDNDYLFIRRHVYKDFIKSRSEEERRYDTDSFMKLYRFVSEKAQKNTPLGDWNLIRSHNVRKYFNSTLLNAGCDSFHVEFLMGHTLDATRAAYFRASPEKLKEIYKKYVPYLMVQKELDVSESPDYLAIKRENDILRAETARHVIARREFQELRSMITNLHSCPIPDLDQNATPEERAVYEEMLAKEKEGEIYKNMLKTFLGIE
ncbi:MAG: tyrosine-type recombinase/integrase [Methanobacterium sp.]